MRTGAPAERIELVSRREPETVVGGGPDYLIYAGDRLVGRIYQRAEQWFCGVQGIFTSMKIGQLHGLAKSLAKQRLRSAFDVWLAWALAAPSSHLSYATIRRDLTKRGRSK